MKISELKKGDIAKIIKYEGSEKTYRNKLLAMGLTPGATFQLVRIAPLGDPVEIKLRGFSLVLRKKESQALVVEKSL